MSTYEEKLKNHFWIAKRHWIIKRDNYQCKAIVCTKPKINRVFEVKSIVRGGNNLKIENNIFLVDEENIELHVHHKYYIEGKEPWDYNDDALITLCPECHQIEHQTTTIPVLTIANKVLKNASICDRCGGSGYIPPYDHIENGICFKCFGEGVIL